MSELSKKLIFSNTYHEIITKELADIYSISAEEIFDGSRKKNKIFAKRLYIFILRNMFFLTLYEIAEITNLHHASVIHHNRKFEFFYGKYAEDTEVYKRIQNRILEVEIDESIRLLEEKNTKIKKELTKLYKIKNNKNERQERKNLLTKQY